MLLFRVIGLKIVLEVSTFVLLILNGDTDDVWVR